MDPDEIFKSFFGTSFPDFGHRRVSPGEEGSDSSWERESHHGSDLFGDFHQQLHRQMEEMDRQMQDVFRIFQLPDQMPSVIPALPEGSKEKKAPSGSSARDLMLKEGAEAPTPPSQSPAQPFRHFKPFIGTFFYPHFKESNDARQSDSIPVEERKDEDLDSKSPKSDEIVGLFERKQQPSLFSFFSGSSMNIQTSVGADGVTEERRTVRDSEGREETTVTRRVGDSCHTLTTIKDQNGQEERKETFHNIDKEKMPEFDRHWQGREDSITAPSFTQPNSATEGKLSDSRGFFRKFFGF